MCAVKIVRETASGSLARYRLARLPPREMSQGNRIWNFLDGECFGLRDSAEMDSTSER